MHWHLKSIASPVIAAESMVYLWEDMRIWREAIWSALTCQKVPDS